MACIAGQYVRRWLRRPAIDPLAAVIDSWLLADRDAPRKQRHTARRVWQRLVAENGATVSEVTVSRYVARRRVELGLVQREGSIPQTHLAGGEAEVDFGEFYATIAGVWVKCWVFVMRLSHSGRAFHVAFGTQAQEAFLEGHVLGFEQFGGVPGRVRYDNLKPAVVRVPKGRDRTEPERFSALRSHYGFDSFFCRPGIEGARMRLAGTLPLCLRSSAFPSLSFELAIRPRIHHRSGRANSLPTDRTAADPTAA